MSFCIYILSLKHRRVMNADFISKIYSSSEYVYFPHARKLVSEVMNDPEKDLSSINLEELCDSNKQTGFKVMLWAAAFFHYLGMKILPSYRTKFEAATNAIIRAIDSQPKTPPSSQKEESNPNIERSTPTEDLETAKSPIPQHQPIVEVAQVETPFDRMVKAIKETGEEQIGDLFSALKDKLPLTKWKLKGREFTITLEKNTVVLAGNEKWSDKDPTRLTFYGFNKEISGSFDVINRGLIFNSGFRIFHTHKSGPTKRPSLSEYNVMKIDQVGDKTVFQTEYYFGLIRYTSYPHLRPSEELADDWKKSKTFSFDSHFLDNCKKILNNDVLKQRRH